MKLSVFILTLLFIGGSMTEAMAESSKIYTIRVKTIEGKETTLAEYKGKALLIVNVASKCGFTRQYEGLQDLYKKYKEQGLEILGFPANNFMFQEPGDEKEIKKFCSLKYNVTFPMFSKIDVKGKNTHPLYQYLTEEAKEDVSWNFNKFLVSPEGRVIAHFGSKIEPLSKELTEKVESVLPEK